MGLDGLLTFFGIGAAILAITDPVTRRALLLFVAKRSLLVFFVLSFILILLADLIEKPRPVVAVSSRAIAFLCLVALSYRAWQQYSEARITKKHAGAFGRLLAVALLEGRFSEIDRVLRSNRDVVAELLTPEARRLLFDPRLVAAMVESGFLIHLELLSVVSFLESLVNRLSVVEIVVRTLLDARESPIRSAVIRNYGGDETHEPEPASLELFAKTFRNPQWYSSTGAHYPLLLAALERMRTGDIDAEYNRPNDHFTATQGISSRSRSTAYLACKTHVLALKEVITKQADGDFYVSDLLDLFREILSRSQYDEAVWKDFVERPTPYAWLLAEILSDLQELSAEALRASCQRVTDGSTEPESRVPWRCDRGSRMAAPPRIARDLAMIWSYCCEELVRSEGNVAWRFVRVHLGHYLGFLLQVKHSPHDAFGGGIGGPLADLEPWYELFVGEFRKRLSYEDEQTCERVQAVIDSLDSGKSWVRDRESFKVALGLTTTQTTPASCIRNPIS